MADYDIDPNTIKSDFFIQSHLAEYKRELDDVLAKQSLDLLNLEQLCGYLTSGNLDDQKTYTKNVNAFKTQFATTSKICGDINPSHINTILNKLLLSYNVYRDMLVLVDADYQQYRDSSIEDRLKTMHGFLVVQRDVYEREPKAYMARLVCSGMRGGATLLMGAYLYTIKLQRASVTQLGILELFRGYENIAGFCAYSKFGFIPKLDYVHTRFSEKNVELPMSVDVGRLSLADIIGVVRGRTRVSQVDMEQIKSDPVYENLVYVPLCSRGGFVEGAEGDTAQMQLAKLYNRLYVAYYTMYRQTKYTATASGMRDKNWDTIQDLIGQIQRAKAERRSTTRRGSRTKSRRGRSLSAASLRGRSSRTAVAATSTAAMTRKSRSSSTRKTKSLG